MSEVSTRPQVGATKSAARNKETPSPAPAAAQPSEVSPPGASSTLIVLTLRPTGKKFNGDRVERAKEAGFDWLNGVHKIGFSCPDTGEEIARQVVHGGKEATGMLDEIQVHIDPEHCATMWRAGTRLFEMLTKFAILVGGHLCDGMGKPMQDADIDAVRAHIDAVMKNRVHAEREARTVTLPSGERRELSELSFAYTVLREAGSKRTIYRHVDFDAPAMNYLDGRAHGIQMANEIVEFYRRHRIVDTVRVMDILEAAFERRESRHGNYDKAEVANVVSGFTMVIETLIKVGAQHLNPAWLEHQITSSLFQHEQWKERKAALVERLRSGREAAKARRLAASKAGAA